MSEFDRLKETVAQLRAEDGCPWDRALTHADLKATCIEEAAEVICGINILRETGNPESLLEELGDLLLQVVMHAQIAEEEGLFCMEDVARVVADKMIRRHPHVFSGKNAAQDASSKSPAAQEQKADGPPEDAQKADKNQEQISWDEIKKQEKAGKEWMDDYLPEAMEEAAALVERARKRKGLI